MGVFSLTAHDLNYFGKRELAEHSKAIRPQDGGESTRLRDNLWNFLLTFNPFWKHNDIPPAISEKLLSMLSDDEEKKYLMVELAVTIDIAVPFVKSTYNLEGDGPLALTCYEAISTVNVAARQAHYPNLEAVVRKCGFRQ